MSISDRPYGTTTNQPPLSLLLAPRVAWSAELVVIDSSMPLGEALDRIRSTTARWIVVRCLGGAYLCAFSPDELLQWPQLRRALDSGTTHLTEPLESVLDLRREYSSTKTDDTVAPPAIDRQWRLLARAPSIDRYVHVDAYGRPKSVGILLAAATTTRLRGRTRASPASREWVELGPSPGPELELPVSASPSRAPAVLEGEGTTPVRQPSIDADRPLLPGAEVVLTVDLLREAVDHTQGGPLAFGVLPSDWKSLDLSVHLQCELLDFESTEAIVTMRRDAASIPARFNAKVRQCPPGARIVVIATFMHGTRFCGSATRTFEAGKDLRPAVAPIHPGFVAVEPHAAQPDLTVHISKLDKDKPGRLRWLVVTPRFEGLPARLEEDIELERSPAAEATALFKEFAVLVRGEHTRTLDGFGTRLWKLAPATFRAVYWALWDHYRRPLAIQFVTDEPHMPWELLRPVRDDESEIHPPLALKHAVARWLKAYDGYMRNELPAGRIYTIAPNYRSVNRVLQRAQAESELLVRDFSAHREDGTRAALLRLLETEPPPESIAVLHFAGHGKFTPEAAIQANIALEDGELTASEVERPEVRLGRACRTLVFFNACEVGSVGAVFGEVGGWADAFLSRQFGGFIAPLWSVDDEDAGVVAVALLERIFKRHEPIGEALRAVREAHGATSPTFYSYLFYGDVTAQIAP